MASNPRCPPFRIPSAHLAAGWLVLVSLVLSGCAGTVISEDEWERRTMRVLKGRKAASQAVVDGDSIANVPADRYVNPRTALLLGGEGRVTTRLAPNGRTAIVGWELRPGRNGDGGVSSATAISPDGYYLTAAHAIGSSGLQMVRATPKGLEVTRVRVVWKGSPSDGGPDLALIHAPSRDQLFFPLGAPPARASQTRVWTAGFGDIRQNQSRGRLRKVGPVRHASDGSAWRLLEHTAPLMRGDSGGPLVDREGRVLGINTEFLVQPANLLGFDHLRVYRPTAIAPDPQWLEALVQQDRARRRGRGR